MKTPKVLLRFDDICPTMNWEQWNKAVQMMEAAGTVALIGVIPDCKDPDLMIDAPRDDFWEHIKSLQQKGYTIAMHGYNHVFDIKAKGIVTPLKQSEFAGHPYEEQYDKIIKGKKILSEHGIETDIFFAPAHSYDNNKLKALSNCGFKYISDGKSLYPYTIYGIKCLPCRNGGAAKIGKKGYYTSIFHAHEWVNNFNKHGFLEFEKTLDNYKNCIVPFEIYKNQLCGNQLIQRIDQYLYVLWQNHVRPFLSSCKFV